MNRIERLYREADERILVLDGAMGTAIQSYGLQEDDFRTGPMEAMLAEIDTPLKGCSDILSITRFDLIEQIYRSYIEAGADIITTNTFGANLISMREYGVQELCYEVNLAAAETARAAVEAAQREDGKIRFVAGSIGPTNKTASISPKVEDPGYRDVTFDDLAEAYKPQVRGLLDGGADIFLIETVFDTLNCKAALFAVRSELERRGMRLERPFPVMVSGTLSDASGRTLSGQTVEAFIVSLEHADLFSIGLNCSMGAEELRPHIETASKYAGTRVSVHPNAGLPDQFGDYTQGAQRMGEILEGFMADGLVNIAGGCCGTTSEHIRVLSGLAAAYAPRPVRPREPVTALSGLEPLYITPEKGLINIGERTNVSGSRRFARLIREGKFDRALAVARSQVDSGAQIIDVCMDDALLDVRESMVRFLNLTAAEPDIARVPVMIDSSDWEVIEAGLKVVQGRGVVNSISLKNGEEQFLEQARMIASYGAAMVVMLFDERGQADTYERKIETAERSFRLLTEPGGIRAEHIIIDPNVLAVATGMPEHDRYALDFLEATAWIKKHLPGVKVSGGISNLSFSYRGNSVVREAMHTVFLYHALRAGLDMGIVNPAMVTLYEDIPKDLLEAVEDALLCRRSDAAERLTETAHRYMLADSGRKPVREQDLSADEPVGRRLTLRLMRGVSDYLETDLEEARGECAAEGRDILSLVEGPLMDGMREVGRLFGQGKMFLPQVVKSARVMKQAVELLQPYIIRDASEGSRGAGKVVFATVKGDVHDIGKNIVSVVLSCNSIEVVDLGVMVPANIIIERAIEEQADAVALSGLITPSLAEMIHVAEMMEQRGLSIPLVIGGATTSRLHTALRIDPIYSGPVVHAADASSAVEVLLELLSRERRTAYVRQVSTAYGELRSMNEKGAKSLQLMSIDEARRRGEAFRERITTGNVPEPRLKGIKTLSIPAGELVPYINWKMLFHAWKTPFSSEEALRLREDALSLLAERPRNVRAAAAFYRAGRAGDDLLIFPNGEPRALHLLRQQEASSEGLSLADFIAPLSGGEPRDWIGAFSVTAGEPGSERDDYRRLLAQSLGDRLAEAGAEYLHAHVRRELWGYAPEEQTPPENLLSAGFQGIRPAPGYPAMPDHSEKALILDLLGGTTTTGIELTESQAMRPASSACGIYIAHPAAFYLSVGPIGEDQLADYAGRKQMGIDEVRTFLSVRQTEDMSEET